MSADNAELTAQLIAALKKCRDTLDEIWLDPQSREECPLWIADQAEAVAAANAVLAKAGMKIEEVRAILRPLTRLYANSVRLDGYLNNFDEVRWDPRSGTVELDGNQFTADQLEAIAAWMRENVDPTRE